jgi:hypothetical protein
MLTTSLADSADKPELPTGPYPGPMSWLKHVMDHKQSPSPAQFKVLVTLIHVLDWTTGEGFASQPFLAKKAGIKDIRTVRAALNWATDHGFAERTRRGHHISHSRPVASEWKLTVPQQDIECTVGSDEGEKSDLRPNPTGHPMQANRTSDAANGALDAPPSSLSSASLSESSLSTRGARVVGEEIEKREEGSAAPRPAADAGAKPPVENDYWVNDQGYFSKVSRRPKKQGEALVQLTPDQARHLWSKDDMSSHSERREYMLGFAQRETQPQAEVEDYRDLDWEDDDDRPTQSTQLDWYVHRDRQTYRVAGRCRIKRGEIRFTGTQDELLRAFPYLAA